MLVLLTPTISSPETAAKHFIQGIINCLVQLASNSVFLCVKHLTAVSWDVKQCHC